MGWAIAMALVVWIAPAGVGATVPVVPEAAVARGTGGSMPLLVRAAEAHLGVPGLEAEWRLSLSPLLPVVDASWTGRSRASTGERDAWAVVARWDLARLLGLTGVEASPAERRLFRARRRLGLHVERTLRERDRLAHEAKTGTGGTVETALVLLAVDEQEARLDALTGGWFRPRESPVERDDRSSPEAPARESRPSAGTIDGRAWRPGW